MFYNIGSLNVTDTANRSNFSIGQLIQPFHELLHDTSLSALKWPRLHQTHISPLTYMGQQGAGETMTSNDPPACPIPTQTRRAATPCAQTKNGAALSQTAAEPYGEVPHRVKDYRYIQSTPLHAALTPAHTIYAYVHGHFHRIQTTGVEPEHKRRQELEHSGTDLFLHYNLLIGLQPPTPTSTGAKTSSMCLKRVLPNATTQFLCCSTAMGWRGSS